MENLQRRDVNWEKVPFVPRPSLVADPITAFGKKRSKDEPKESILTRINRAGIKPNQEILNRPIQPYISARDETRNKVLSEVRRSSELRCAGGSLSASTDKNSMDVILPRLHQATPAKSTHRRIFFVEPLKYLK